MNSDSITLTYMKNRIKAEQILNSVLNLEMPSEKLLLKNYHPKQIKIVQESIDEFIDHIKQETLPNKKPVLIKTTNVYETELVKKKQEINNEPHIQRIKKKLINWEIPEDKDLELIYANYAPVIKKHFEAFNSLNKERICGIPATTHLGRCSFMSESLSYDLESSKPNKYYNALWGMHDSLEDLFPTTPKLKLLNHEKKYKLNELKLFLDEYVPKEHQKDLILLSNVPDLILKQLKNKNVKLKDKYDLEQQLNLIRKKSNDETIINNAEFMLEQIPENDFSNPENFYKDIKWKFYNDVFLYQLAESAIKQKKLISYEGKGEIDLLDNFVGRHSRDLRGRKKSIKKILLWAAHGDKIINNFEHSPYLDLFEDRKTQLRNHASYATKEIAIHYLSQQIEKQDHLTSTISTLKDLRNALYHNLKTEIKP